MASSTPDGSVFLVRLSVGDEMSDWSPWHGPMTSYNCMSALCLPDLALSPNFSLSPSTVVRQGVSAPHNLHHATLKLPYVNMQSIKSSTMVAQMQLRPSLSGSLSSQAAPPSLPTRGLLRTHSHHPPWQPPHGWVMQCSMANLTECWNHTDPVSILALPLTSVRAWISPSLLWAPVSSSANGNNNASSRGCCQNSR